MPKYTVKGSQTLFDIALHLYGTIEGLFDLLISNPELSMMSNLVAGQELEYHDEFVINQGIVNKFAENNQIIINGERNVYHKPISEELVVIIKAPEDLDMIEFTISGEGSMFVDWGDNSEIEEVLLSHTQTLISHYFDNVVDERRIRIYGNFTIQRLDFSRLKGHTYLLRPLTVDEFVCQSNDNTLQSLFLFEGTYFVDLSKMLISDLSPIYDMSLMELDLRKARFQEPHILSDYLIYISENYGTRRACKVYLDSAPSEAGMAAIRKIISEPEWNTPDKWEFHINDTIYTATDGTNTDGNI